LSFDKIRVLIKSESNLIIYLQTDNYTLPISLFLINEENYLFGSYALLDRRQKLIDAMNKLLWEKDQLTEDEIDDTDEQDEISVEKKRCQKRKHKSYESYKDKQLYAKCMRTKLRRLVRFVPQRAEEYEIDDTDEKDAYREDVRLILRQYLKTPQQDPISSSSSASQDESTEQVDIGKDGRIDMIPLQPDDIMLSTLIHCHLLKGVVSNKMIRSLREIVMEPGDVIISFEKKLWLYKEEEEILREVYQDVTHKFFIDKLHAKRMEKKLMRPVRFVPPRAPRNAEYRMAQCPTVGCNWTHKFKCDFDSSFEWNCERVRNEFINQHLLESCREVQVCRFKRAELEDDEEDVQSD
jgi:hypothetical protein